MNKGDIVKGKVTEILPLGVKVQIENEDKEGFLPIFEYNYELCGIGQEIIATVKDINTKNIELSNKVYKENPWLNMSYKIGDRVTGRVIWKTQRRYNKGPYYIGYIETKKDIPILFETSNKVEIGDILKIRIISMNKHEETIKGEVDYSK